MSKYQKVSTSFNFPQREEEILQFWKQNKIFELSQNEKGQCFSFFDGPPTANGMPHIGHVLTRTIKDVVPRFQTMKGKKVLRKAGWDTHGLPVELEVEKSLNINGKKQIEEYGIEPFVTKCRESVWKYKKEWEQLSERVGYFVDMQNPYITYDNNYIESEFWAIKTIFDKGLLYKGYKIVPYCPRCGTALSSHETAQGYKDVKEKSAVVKFAVKDQPNTYILAWTTTPWTLPSNVALAMNPQFTYAKIKVGDEFFIIAKELISKHFEEGSFEIIEQKKGSEYEKLQYLPLFDFATPKKPCHFVINADFVTLSDGTGIVHIAPAYGSDDAEAAKAYDLPVVQLVGVDGKFVDGCGELSGVFCKTADKQILRQLKDSKNLFSEIMFEHSYPHCWRCDTPLIYFARQSWFVKMTEVKDKLLKINNQINWYPPTIGSGRMGNFLENVIDWGISRDRYWGTPLPVWVCDKCQKVHVVGSRKELHDLSNCGLDIELHRPYIDQVKWNCSCGGTFVREKEVIDCWFDSGSMPYAQFHYPFQNKQLFEENFPAQFISEAVDQTRGWFYTLIAISTLLFDKPPFENCIVLGLVCDEKGIKMSKHKGNGVNPYDSFNKQGADAVRWYFYTNSAPWLPNRFYDEAVSESQRRFLGTLWNTYAFFVLYADIDGFDPSKYTLKDCKLTLMDRWILSELNILIETVDSGLSNYEITQTAKAIEKFVDMLSNWYVRRCRDRFWGANWTEDKQAAYMTLYTVLVEVSKIAAPFVPFVTESIYQNLVTNFFENAPKSVHLCDFPVADKRYIDKKLSIFMQKVLDIVVLGRSARNSANIKNRQPLSKMYVKTQQHLSPDMAEIVCDELNIKSLVSAEGSDTSFCDYEIKPQLRTLGPKYGKILNKIRDFLANLGQKAQDFVETIKNGNQATFVIDQTEVCLTEEDVLVSTRDKEGFCVASDKGTTVVLDTKLTKELIDEGLMRELVSKIQTMRKECDFVVTDRIKIQFEANDQLTQVFENFKNQICEDTLADSIEKGTIGDFSKTWDINGNQVTLHLTK